jgi:hypothetical protein
MPGRDVERNYMNRRFKYPKLFEPYDQRRALVRLRRCGAVLDSEVTL